VVHVGRLEEIKIKRLLSELLKAKCTCDCSVPLVLSNYHLFLCDDVADIRLTGTVCVVVTQTGHPVQNADR